jgi:hypothetical protein
VPTQPYYAKDGERLPSNTTILNQNLGWAKEGLKHWAWKLGTEGKDYRNVVADAADVGTLAHALIEADIKQQPMPEYPYEDIVLIAERAHRAFKNYLKWKGMVNFKLLTMETPCISEVLRFGTTLDISAVSGKRAVVEVKTSNKVHEDMFIQMAAQKFAWDETHPGEEIEEFHLLKLGKETGSFSHHYIDPADLMPVGMKAFRALRELHDTHKMLKSFI